MAYEQQWSSANPGHIVYLIDLSGSMKDKIDYTINVMANVFNALILKCNTTKNRLTCTVIGYNNEVQTIWDNVPIIPNIKDLVSKFKKEKVPIFNKEKEFKPKNQTFMRLAFDAARKDIEKWIKEKEEKNQKAPAPIVINITDGIPFEGNDKNGKDVDVYNNTLLAAQALMKIGTADGNVRVFNIHHDPNIKGEPIYFPSEPPKLRQEQFLFEASSAIEGADLIREIRCEFEDLEIKDGARYMFSNVKDPSELVKIIAFGSSTGFANDGRY